MHRMRSCHTSSESPVRILTAGTVLTQIAQLSRNLHSPPLHSTSRSRPGRARMAGKRPTAISAVNDRPTFAEMGEAYACAMLACSYLWLTC